MPHLIIALLALGIAAAQAGIGGVKLLYSLPAYGLIGLAALCSLFEPPRHISTGTRNLCLATTIGMAAWVLGRSYFAPVDYLARHDLFMTLGTVTVYLLASIFLTSTRSRHVLLTILLICAAAHLACGVVQFHSSSGHYMFFSSWIEQTGYKGRATGFYLNPNHLAGLLEMLGLMAASLACWSSWRLVTRMIAGYAALLCFIGVALTGSRGGYVSTLTGMIVLAAMSLFVIRKLRPVQFWPSLVAVLLLFSAAVGGGATLMLKSQNLQDRKTGIFDAKRMRVVRWEAALKQFALSPVVGTGAGTYLLYGSHFRTAPVEGETAHVRNDYLELLCEYGVVGALVMFLFLGVHLQNGIIGFRRILRELEDVGWGMLNDELALLLGALAAISALLVHSALDSNLHVPGNALVVAFLFSIIAAPTIETLLPEETAGSFTMHWLRFLAPAIGLYLLVVGTPRVEGEFYADYAERELRAKEYTSAVRCAEGGVAVEKRNPYLFYFLGKARYLLGRDGESDAGEDAQESREALHTLNAGLELFPPDLRRLQAPPDGLATTQLRAIREHRDAPDPAP